MSDSSCTLGDNTRNSCPVCMRLLPNHTNQDLKKCIRLALLSNGDSY